MLRRAESHVTFEGAHCKVDLVCVDQASGPEYLIDVEIVNVDYPSVGLWLGLGDAERLLEADERLRRRHQVVQRHINGSGSTKIFGPFVASSFGGLGPLAGAFLKKVYSRARAAPWRYFFGRTI